MQFLYPTQKKFPFDVACGEIVAELEARNFDVPGIRVEFSTYGRGEQWMRHVSRVGGADFQLRFGRIQGLMPGGQYNDVAAVTGLAIPRKHLHVCDDESGPMLWLYVGDDWERDRERFLRSGSPGINNRRRGGPRTYVPYKGACECATLSGSGLFLARSHTHAGRRSPILLADDDLGREYGPAPGEPTQLSTALILEEFRAYVEDVVLPSIRVHARPSTRVDAFPAPPKIPFPASIGPLFCFGTLGDARRIRRGQADLGTLPPADRYGMGDGRRLVSLDVPNDGTVTPIAAYAGGFTRPVVLIRRELALDEVLVLDGGESGE